MVTLTIVAAAVTRIEMERSAQDQVKVTPVKISTCKQQEWRFHTNHGKNIVLSNDSLTAEKRGCEDNIVVADQPMVPDVVYEVQIDKVEYMLFADLPCGVVLTDPDHLRLPHTATSGWGSEAVVLCGAVYNRGHRVVENLENDTYGLSEGTRVGVMVTTKAELHLWVNGSDRGVIATTVPTPCFAFFELYNRYPFVPQDTWTEGEHRDQQYTA